MALSRIQHLLEQVTRFEEHADEFYRLVESRIPELKGWLTRGSTDRQHQENLRQHAESIDTRIRQTAAGMKQAIDKIAKEIAAQISQSDKSLSLACTLDRDGKLIQMRRIVSPDAYASRHGH
jgi:predicted metal-dependent hydrolase